MKLRSGILLLAMFAGVARAQNPDVIQDTRSTLQNTQKKQVIDQNAALAASGQSSPTAQPAVAQSATKPAVPSSTTANQKAANHASSQAAKVPAKAATSKPKASPATVTANKSEKNATPVAVEDKKTPVEPNKKETRNYTAAGRRDPFVSPVVSRSMVAAGCSSGKRCLAIDQIVLTGVVKSDSGMIAVVVNAMNKAYFLRENDPVFNGYVVRITGDSIVFQETVQDNLGKPLTREVTKKVSAPAV
jgi:Tfp pilus assembly protein PilP